MKLRIQIKPEDQSMPSKSLTVTDKNAQEVKNKIKFLYDSLERADDKADITVFKSDVRDITGAGHKP